MYGTLAYGDTKGRSMSAADGAEDDGISFDMCYKSVDVAWEAQKGGF